MARANTLGHLKRRCVGPAEMHHVVLFRKPIEAQPGRTLYDGHRRLLAEHMPPSTEHGFCGRTVQLARVKLLECFRTRRNPKHAFGLFVRTGFCLPTGQHPHNGVLSRDCFGVSHGSVFSVSPVTTAGQGFLHAPTMARSPVLGQRFRPNRKGPERESTGARRHYLRYNPQTPFYLETRYGLQVDVLGL